LWPDIRSKRLASQANFDTTRELCITTGPNDPTPLCVTKAQLADLLSQSAAAGLANPTPATTTSADTPPIIQINGDNPAYIHIGDSRDVNPRR